MNRFFSYIVNFLSLFLVTLVLLLFTGCSKDDNIKKEEPFVRLLENESVYSKIFNKSINYAVLLPKNYSESKESYPVVYLLHGYGDDQTSWYRYGLIQYYSDLYESENGPMIFVMPQGFNTYYVNRYNGNLPYMDFFVNELVPSIDSIYRTKKDKTQRAVMGYSMGGYGALILPVKNPDVFSISVPLSMSFRTDEQYIAEPQDVFDNQWGLIFGGYQASGEARLTDYFKDYSPFHFFNVDDLSAYASLKIFMDCGDDEESLHITNGKLHNLMFNRNICHEYRVRNGGHSWDYWHKSLPEALKFISYGFRGINYPENPDPINVGEQISSEQYILENLSGYNIEIGVFKPLDYSSSTNAFPVIFFIHDFEGASRNESALSIVSYLNNKMLSGDIPSSIIVEIPEGSIAITSAVLSNVINQISTNYRIVAENNGRVLMGNGKGGATASYVIQDFSNEFNACFLFDAELANNVSPVSSVFYYLDIPDKSNNYLGNYNLFISLRNNENTFEYRVRQGTSSLQSVINGLDGAITYLSKKLKNQ